MPLILIPLASLFTGLGIYAWTRKKPMWFWSGSTVDASEITDVRAYNRANGLMWIGYALIFWIGAILGFFRLKAGGILVGIGGIVGAVVLIFLYRIIYRKYRRQ